MSAVSRWGVQEKLVSIIIPIYNVEKYLVKCLQSVQAQTYKNIQVLMIDDGSTDGSAELCKDFVAKDNRFRYFYKENGGLSDARNYGISRADGQYLTFVDSDDYLSPVFVEQLYACFNADPAVEVSVCSMDLVDETYKTIGSYSFPTKVYTGEEALREVLYSRGLECYACAKMFSKKIFETVSFTKGRLFEDIDIIYKIFLNVKKVQVVGGAYYYYLQRKNSITQAVFNRKQLVLLDIMQEMMSYIAVHAPNLLSAAIRRKVSSELWLIAKINSCQDRDKDLVKQLTKSVKKDAKIVSRDRQSSRNDKIKLILLKYFGPRVFSLVYNSVGTGAK